MLAPFIDIIFFVIGLIEIGLFVWIILQVLVQFNIVNPHQPLVSRIRYFLDQLFDPILRPIRRVIPLVGGIDLSPLVLIILLRFVQSALIHWV